MKGMGTGASLARVAATSRAKGASGAGGGGTRHAGAARGIGGDDESQAFAFRRHRLSEIVGHPHGARGGANRVASSESVDNSSECAAHHSLPTWNTATARA